ncbi:MAG: hypothetical protein WCK35_13360 [Chloroflexota bacterium]
MRDFKEVTTTNTTCNLPQNMAENTTQVSHTKRLALLPVIENLLTKKLIGTSSDGDMTFTNIEKEQETTTTKLEAETTPKVTTCFSDDDLRKALDTIYERMWHHS